MGISMYDVNFLNLLDALRDNGYKVTVESKDEYDMAIIEGNGIFGGFATKHDSQTLYATNIQFNGKITADNDSCWDKPSRCPLTLSIPQGKHQIEFLLKQLKFLGSKDGENASNEFRYEEFANDYPR